ncbi:hypothetical protein ACLM5J_17195 [Nocardioides sp. Bht2]|uniref:hypothetical protein n=1 Tax=Nocardioides sp. Bht2 TaxID=3392297 RepID=UPI0039B61488
MIEIDAKHVPYEVTDLDAGCLLGVISQGREQAFVMARRQLRLAHQWCVLNPVVDRVSAASLCDDPALASLDLDDVLGGQGTPAVAAFAAEEFTAAAGVSRYAALSLLADALDLHHRLPRLWAKVELLEVPGWKARRVAELTRKLSVEAAEWFDAQLVVGERYGWKTIERMLAMAVAKFHPELIRDKTGPLSKSDWGVTLTHKHGSDGTAAGTSTLDVIGDSLDLARFHDLVCEEAERLKRAGDGDTLDQRKAKALGSIAEAQDTLDFGGLDGDPATVDRACRDHDRDGNGLDKLDQRGRKSRRGLRVFVHTTLADLFGADDLTLADTDRLGPRLPQLHPHICRRRPRPHQPLRRGHLRTAWPTGPNHARESGAVVSPSSPRKDLCRLALRPQPRRHLHLAQQARRDLAGQCIRHHPTRLNDNTTAGAYPAAGGIGVVSTSSTTGATTVSTTGPVSAVSTSSTNEQLI